MPSHGGGNVDFHHTADPDSPRGRVYPPGYEVRR